MQEKLVCLLLVNELCLKWYLLMYECVLWNAAFLISTNVSLSD